MNQMLELPASLLHALEQQAEASGTTPQGWIAARLAEANGAGGSNVGVAEAIEAELRRLAALPANWDRYDAPPIDPALIAAAAQFVRAMRARIAVRPRVVPMSPGNLQLEWHRGQKVLELEFESPNSIRYLKWDPPAGIEEEDSFPASDLDRAAQLIQWLLGGITA